MPDKPTALPGKGFFGWLGRQVGHVTKAVQADVTRPAPPPGDVLFRAGHVEQMPHPTEPGLILRRTVVDEVVVERPKVD